MDYRFKNKNYLTFLSYKLSSLSIVIKLYLYSQRICLGRKWVPRNFYWTNKYKKWVKIQVLLTKFNLDRSLPKYVKRKHPSEYKKGRPAKEYLATKG